MRKFVALTLSTLLLIVPLISCAKSNDVSSGGTTESVTSSSATAEIESTTEERIYADLPVKDYNGYEFTFLTRTINGWNDAFVHHDIYAEEENGELINDAVFRRNVAIEEKYNVKIKEIAREYTNGDFTGILKGAVQSGDPLFDVVLPQPASTTTLLLDGLFTNLYNVPYLDFTKPWWNDSANKSLSINDTVYYTFSDLSIMDNNACSAVLFNKQMLSDLGLESPYSLVKEGKWTISKLYEMSKEAPRDVNGDGLMKTGDDTFGFLGQMDVMLAFYNGGGEMFASKNSDGVPQIAFGTERGFSVISDIMDLMYDSNTSVNAHKTNDSINNNIKIFSDGRALFFWENIYIVTALRALEIDFGILPTPKYNEEQQNYCTTLSNHGSTGIAVPNIDTDLERTGIILEALTAESKYTLTPAYYDTMLVNKYSRDDDSKEMLDIIFKNVLVDIGIFYDFGGFASTYMALSLKDDRNVMSLFDKNAGKIQKSIDNFNEKFAAIRT